MNPSAATLPASDAGTAPPRAVLDANVLFSEPLRAVLLGAARAGLLAPHWTDRIVEETCRSLLRTGRATQAGAGALRNALARDFPAALVTGYEALLPAMGNHPGDRHVAAAAVHAAVPLILTRNLHDFRKLPAGLKAQSPDAFLVELSERRPDAVETLLRELAGGAEGLPALLAELAKIVPRFAKRMRSVSPPE